MLTASIFITIFANVADSQLREEACETIKSKIHITKDEFDELGATIRNCVGDVDVNRCEGACNSKVSPSAITPNGFSKECYCCRESFLSERTITLYQCYDPDGIRLTGDKSEMVVKLREPVNCKCSKCGNSPI